VGAFVPMSPGVSVVTGVPGRRATIAAPPGVVNLLEEFPIRCRRRSSAEASWRCRTNLAVAEATSNRRRQPAIERRRSGTTFVASSSAAGACGRFSEMRPRKSDPEAMAA
jgi:hypothetical protein